MTVLFTSGIALIHVQIGAGSSIHTYVSLFKSDWYGGKLIGVSLPSLLLAKTHRVRHVILSDLPSILPLIQSCFKLNDIDQALYDICELQWGDLEAAKRMIAMVEKQQKNRKIDYILGSDTFYDPAGNSTFA